MAKFSANLGYLWTEHSLVDGVRAAAAAGFNAVECHLPYAVPVDDVNAVLEETGLPLIGINTAAGGDEAGSFGLTALPGRTDEARAAIEQALDYAAAVKALHVHVLAGRASGDYAQETYVYNLGYAAQLAAERNLRVVVEPLNERDAPGYFLSHVEQAVDIINAVGADNLKLMFDCYHVQIMQGDLMKRIERHIDYIGHVQIASVPGRHEPDQGEVAYERLVPYLDHLGYQGFVAAEYRPRRGTEEGLGWLRWFRV